MTKEELQAKCNELEAENDLLKEELKALEDAAVENGAVDSITTAVSVAAVVKSVTKDVKTGGSTVEIRPARGGGWVAVALPVDEDGGLAAGDEVEVVILTKEQPAEELTDAPE